MTRDRAFQIAQEGACLICAILVWRDVARFEGTEFSGGRITGPILDMADMGILFFLVALILGLFRTRLSSVSALAASLLALPNFLYVAFPGSFRRIFQGDYSVPVSAEVVRDVYTLVAMIALTLTAILSLCNLMARQPKANS